MGSTGGVGTTKVKINKNPRGGGQGGIPRALNKKEAFTTSNGSVAITRGGQAYGRTGGLEIHNKSIANWAMGDAVQAKHMVEFKVHNKSIAAQAGLHLSNTKWGTQSTH